MKPVTEQVLDFIQQKPHGREIFECLQIGLYSEQICASLAELLTAGKIQNTTAQDGGTVYVARAVNRQ